MKKLIKLISFAFLLLQFSYLKIDAMENQSDYDEIEELKEALSYLSLNNTSFLDAFFLSNLRLSHFAPDVQNTIKSNMHELSNFWKCSKAIKKDLYIRITSMFPEAERVFYLAKNVTPDKPENFLLTKEETQNCLKTRVMSTSNSCTILDETTGEKFGPFTGQGYIMAANISPDKTKVITASKDQKKAILWNAKNKEPLYHLEHDKNVTWVGFWNGYALTASLDKKIKIWNLQGGSLIITLEHDFPVFRVYVMNKYIKACSLAEENINYWLLYSVDYNDLSFEQFILAIKLQQCLETKKLITLNKKWIKIFQNLPELLKIKFLSCFKKNK